MAGENKTRKPTIQITQLLAIAETLSSLLGARKEIAIEQNSKTSFDLIVIKYNRFNNPIKTSNTLYRQLTKGEMYRHIQILIDGIRLAS